MELAHDGPLASPLWINGRACLTVGNQLFDVVNPVTGVAQHRVPLCGAEESAQALAAARDAAAIWTGLGLSGRQDKLAQLATALEGYSGHFAKLLMADRGVAQADAEAEVVAAVQVLRADKLGQSGVLGLVVGAERPVEAGETEFEGLAQGFARIQGEVDFPAWFIAIEHDVLLALFQQALMPGAQIRVSQYGRCRAERPDFQVAFGKTADFSVNSGQV